MKDIDYWYRNGIPVATAKSDNDTDFFFFVGFSKDSPYYKSGCSIIDNMAWYHYSISFDNEALNTFWWLGVSTIFGKDSIYNSALAAVDKLAGTEKEPETKSGGFEFL